MIKRVKDFIFEAAELEMEARGYRKKLFFTRTHKIIIL